MTAPSIPISGVPLNRLAPMTQERATPAASSAGAASAAFTAVSAPSSEGNGWLARWAEESSDNWEVSDPGAPIVAKAPAREEEGDWGEDGFGIGDVVDIINPLQHIPVVSSVYRSITGDEISPAARATGAAIYGGPIGIVTALVENITRAETGRGVGENVVASLLPEKTAETGTPEFPASAPNSAHQTPVGPQLAALSRPEPPAVTPHSPIRDIPRANDAIATVPRAGSVASQPFSPQGKAVHEWMMNALDRYAKLKQHSG